MKESNKKRVSIYVDQNTWRKFRYLSLIKQMSCSEYINSLIYSECQQYREQLDSLLRSEKK